MNVEAAFYILNNAKSPDNIRTLQSGWVAGVRTTISVI